MHSIQPPLCQAPAAWVSVAVWLGLLAVFSALVAPAALLAEDVRTGKLSGLCSAQSRVVADPASDGEAVLADRYVTPLFSIQFNLVNSS